MHAFMTERAAPLCLENAQLGNQSTQHNKLTEGRDQRAFQCDGKSAR